MTRIIFKRTTHEFDKDGKIAVEPEEGFRIFERHYRPESYSPRNEFGVSFRTAAQLELVWQKLETD